MLEELDKLIINTFKIGKIKSITDPSKYIVKIEIPDFIEEATAFPMLFLDEPTVGEEVYCIPLNDLTNDVYLYIPLRLDEYIGFRYKGGHIKINEPGAGIEIQSKGRIKIANDDASLYPILKKLITVLMQFKVLTPQGTGITDASMLPDLQELYTDVIKLLK